MWARRPTVPPAPWSRALAMETLCFCPPDRVFIFFPIKLSSWGRPTSLKAERARSFSLPSFARNLGSVTACNTVMCGLSDVSLSWNTICTPPSRRVQNLHVRLLPLKSRLPDWKSLRYPPQYSCQGSLAAAGAPNQCHYFTAADLYGHIFQHLLSAVGLEIFRPSSRVMMPPRLQAISRPSPQSFSSGAFSPHRGRL